jgi:SWI/SNF-related matrix-associated actin-dependent regulator of chromatin subfamily A3
VREDPLAFTGRSLASNTRDEFAILEPSFIGDHCWMTLCDASPFGCIGQRMSRVLKRLIAQPDVHLVGIATWPSLEKAKTQWKQSGKSATLLMDISVCGPGADQVAKLVGRALSDAMFFLQPPRFATNSFSYVNPQYLKLPNVSHVQLEDTPVVSPAAPFQEDDKDVSRSELESILDHIPQPKFLRQAFSSVRIRTPLMKYAFSCYD